MNIKFYKTATSFNESCREYLLIDEAINNMFIGNLDLAMSVYSNENYIFGEIDNQDQTELVFMGNFKGQMFLCSPTGNTDNNLYELFSKEIYKTRFRVNGIKAAPPIVDAFAEEYSKLTGRIYEVNMHMNILLLTKLKPITLLNLVIEKINIDNKYELTQDHVHFIKESVSGQEGLYFLLKDAIPVSQAAVRRKVSIGGVYTPEKYRRNGYSSTLVYQLAKRILDEGNSYCVVHTDADNAISNQMYANIGFEHIADMKDIIFLF